jgi:hypothetical protein
MIDFSAPTESNSTTSSTVHTRHDENAFSAREQATAASQDYSFDREATENYIHTLLF